MNPLIISSLVLLSVYSVSGGLLEKCPDEKAGVKAFSDAYDKFRQTVCKKCPNKVGETKEEQDYIAKNIFPALLSKEVLGVDPPEDIKAKTSILASCAGAKAEGDYCGKPQQEAFANCLKGKSGELASAAPWGMSNCKTIQGHMTKNADQIKAKCATLGDKYIQDNCGKSGKKTEPQAKKN